MFRKTTLLTLLGLVASVTAVSGGGEDVYLGLLKSDIRAEKVSIVNDVMEFTDEEASRFWPVYREYDRQQTMIVDDRIRMIEQFSEYYGTFDDKMSKKIAETGFRLEARRTNLKRKFFPRFSKAVGAKRAAQFFQLERQINLLIELQIASELPLLD